MNEACVSAHLTVALETSKIGRKLLISNAEFEYQAAECHDHIAEPNLILAFKSKN